MRVRVPHAAAAMLLLTVLGGTAGAQQLLWERQGVTDSHAFGYPCMVLGDVDSDGYDDIVTVVQALVAGPRIEWQIWTLSGKDGRTLQRTSLGLSQTGWPWTFAKLGDADADGVPDYAVTIFGDTGGNRVEARSGKDGRVLFRVTRGSFHEDFGRAITGAVDIDGDGKPDLLVNAPGVFPHGAVFAYSHKGKLCYAVRGSPRVVISSSHYRDAMDAAGDVDGDGADDFVVVGEDRSAGKDAVFVVSGRSGEILVRGLGSFLLLASGCGDIDGDGVPDFASGSFTGPLVVFSGKNGREIASLPHRNQALRCGMDIDRDGWPDLVVDDRADVLGLSGRTGREIFRVRGGRPGLLGPALALGRPQPGDALPVLAIPEEFGFGGQVLRQQGRIRLFHLAPEGIEIYGDACRGTLGSTPQISASRRSSGGFDLTVRGAAAGSVAVCLIGTSRDRFGGVPLPLALDTFGFPGCSLLTSVELLLVAATGQQGNAAGFGTLHLPVEPSAAGTAVLHAQWLAPGRGSAAPGALSDALRFRFAVQ